MPEAEHVAVRRLVEHQRADRHQGVEPAAGLVDRLADEVRRVGLRQLLGGAGRVRVAELREGHRAGVVPAVDDLGHPLGVPAAGLVPVLGLAGEGDLVDERAVRVELGQVPSGQRAELGQRADAGQVSLGAAPQRQRGAPVPVAGERPVDVVVQPVAVAAVLDVVRVPVRRLVLAQQPVLDRGGADVPGRLRVVEQRGVAAPAVRV